LDFGENEVGAETPSLDRAHERFKAVFEEDRRTVVLARRLNPGHEGVALLIVAALKQEQRGIAFMGEDARRANLDA
jgi:hypothetical protein